MTRRARGIAALTMFLAACSSTPEGPPVRVIVPKGASFSAATDSLARACIVVSPLFFGAVYSWSLREGADASDAGTAFLIAAVILLFAAVIGWIVARRAESAEAAVRAESAAE